MEYMREHQKTQDSATLFPKARKTESDHNAAIILILIASWPKVMSNHVVSPQWNPFASTELLRFNCPLSSELKPDALKILA